MPSLLGVKCEKKWNGKSFCLCLSRDHGVIRCGVIWFRSGVDPALIGCKFKFDESNVATCISFFADLNLTLKEWAW